MAKTPKKRGPKAAPPNEQREQITALRSGVEWKQWLIRFAARERMTPTTLIDRALAEYAKATEFEEPPER